MVQWTGQQDAALTAVSDWLQQKNGPQVFRLFGWAGTGKSTLARHLAGDLESVRYAAFTGKAASVMRRRGCKGAGTIHSLIYTLVSDSEGVPKFEIDPESPAADADLIVIDEVSMVDEALGKDLLSFGTKVLVLGDPFQLPPVQGAGFFTDVEPDIMLTEIHRQAADNPIIAMSRTVREGGRLEYGDYGESKVIGRKQVDQGEVLAADQVLVGRNRTRVTYNDRLRELKGFSKALPEIGEKLVCLRNNPAKRLLNGQIWLVSHVKKKTKGRIEMEVLSEETARPADILTHKAFFSGEEETLSWAERRGLDEFTYGYCLTVHKSQGSQWDQVFLFDESFVFREDSARWLYTGLTRAAERIIVAR
ncbi:MAG: AAA family ATPase [Hyphomicrobiaceae bacterium]|nr:AAA family ATPase [Hyphomicrobiaceae bacterium]MCC0023572.1 AAA family ATPase [Hyphomicrobiaceae bacterium]